MVNGGVPEIRTLNLTFDPGKTDVDSGLSRTHGGSVGGLNMTFYLYNFKLCLCKFKEYW